MAQRDGVGAGWRLYRQWEAERDEAGLLRRAAVVGTVTGGVTTAVAGALLPDGLVGGHVATIVSAVWLGAVLGTVAVVIVLRSSRRARLARQGWRARRGANEFHGTGVAYGADSRIREAWLEDREPEVPVAQRLAAAAAARAVRATRPVFVRGSLITTPFWAVSIVGTGVVLTQPDPRISLGTLGVYSVIGIGGLVAHLHALGRTRAPLETAPDVPEGLRADGRKIPAPRKLLGTGHPDDYT